MKGSTCYIKQKIKIVINRCVKGDATIKWWCFLTFSQILFKTKKPNETFGIHQFNIQGIFLAILSYTYKLKYVFCLKAKHAGEYTQYYVCTLCIC